VSPPSRDSGFKARQLSGLIARFIRDSPLLDRAPWSAKEGHVG